MKITFEKKPKKTEFSKKWLTACIVFSVVFSAASYVLAAFDKNPVPELTIALIETMWGASGVSFVGYAIQNSVRAFTASKFGIPEKRGEPGGKQKKSETAGTQPDCR